MKVINLFLIILIALALVACGAATSAPSPSATEINTVASTTSPTDTPVPSTRTPTATPTRYPTSTPQPTLSPQEVASTIIAEMDIEETHAYSPNGMCTWKRIVAWNITAAEKYNGQFYTYVTAECANQDKPWVLVSRWTDQGLGYPLSSLLGWSVDGKYVYTYDAIIPDGCQPLGGFQENLQQADLDTGELRSIPLTWTGGMALSPDASKVIYYDMRTAEVGVYGFATNKEQLISFELPKSIESWFAGDFTWSLDGKWVLFIIQYGDACFPTGVSLRLVNIEAGNVTLVFERTGQILSIDQWAEPERALISIDGEKYALNPFTGSLTTP